MKKFTRIICQIRHRVLDPVQWVSSCTSESQLVGWKSANYPDDLWMAVIQFKEFVLGLRLFPWHCAMSINTAASIEPSAAGAHAVISRYWVSCGGRGLQSSYSSYTAGTLAPTVFSVVGVLYQVWVTLDLWTLHVNSLNGEMISGQPSQHHENANFSMLIVIHGFAKATSYPQDEKATIENLD